MFVSAGYQCDLANFLASLNKCTFAELAGFIPERRKHSGENQSLSFKRNNSLRRSLPCGDSESGAVCVVSERK